MLILFYASTCVPLRTSKRTMRNETKQIARLHLQIHRLLLRRAVSSNFSSTHLFASMAQHSWEDNPDEIEGDARPQTSDMLGNHLRLAAVTVRIPTAMRGATILI